MKITQIRKFEIYVNQHGKPPPSGYPHSNHFYAWQDFDFFIDEGPARFDLPVRSVRKGYFDFFADDPFAHVELLDRLFPDSYFILNTGSLYHWLTRKFHANVCLRQHPFYKPLMPARPGVAEVRVWIAQREEYYASVFEYFQGRDNFAVLDTEGMDAETVRTTLQTATNRPITTLATAPLPDPHEPHPLPVKLALERQGIPEGEWHRTLS